MNEEIVCTCETVIDGDTINVRHEGRLRTIRLMHIDAPEVGEAFYMESKIRLMQLILGHQCTIFGTGYDRYGRLTGKIFTEELEMPHLALLAEGLAFHYKKYSRCELSASAEAMAKRRYLGLWSEEEYYLRWLQRVNESKRYVIKGDQIIDVPPHLLDVVLEDNNEQFGTPEFYQEFERRIQAERIRTAGIRVKEIDNLI